MTLEQFRRACVAEYIGHRLLGNIINHFNCDVCQTPPFDRCARFDQEESYTMDLWEHIIGDKRYVDSVM